jgi:hypothetical protein
MGMFRFKPTRQFVERYHNIVSCALNMEDLVSGKHFVNSESNKEMSNVF